MHELNHQYGCQHNRSSSRDPQGNPFSGDPVCSHQFLYIHKPASILFSKRRQGAFIFHIFLNYTIYPIFRKCRATKTYPLSQKDPDTAACF